MQFVYRCMRRSRDDPDLRHMIRLLRQPKLESHVIDEVVDLLWTHCKHVDIGEVPAEATWFLSTNAAVQVGEDMF